MANNSRGQRGGGNPYPPLSSWTLQQWGAIRSSLEAADPRVVEAALARLVPNFSTATWLGVRHPLAVDQRAVTNPPFAVPLHAAVEEYVSASVPLHLADSWTYFGRALASISTGSLEVAQHLLYYCELRAALALLFRHGVALLNRKNISLSSSGSQTVPIPNSRIASNVHQSIWVLLREWVRTPAALTFIGRTLSLRGVSLERWIAERPAVGSLSSVLSPLVDNWGLDLARFSEDRSLRNQLSYNPTRLDVVPTGAHPAYIADLYQQIWTLLDPDPSNAFENLDRYISRQAFESIAKQGASAGAGVLGTRSYRDLNMRWVGRVLGSESDGFITQFLNDRLQQPDPAILAQAGRAPSGTLAEQLTGMVGRSVILLRLATGATRDLLSAAGCSATDVDFWIHDMLDVHGIRVPAGSPPNYMDLYDGLSDFLTDLDPLLGESDPSDIALIAEEYSLPFQMLSGFERVPAWSVA